MMCQDAILTHDGDDVGSNGHRTEVEKLVESIELNPIVGRKGLHELKSNATTREVGVGIAVVATLGVENCYRRREDFVRHVVIADDKVDAEFFGIGYFFGGFDAAVEYDDEAHAHFCR